MNKGLENLKILVNANIPTRYGKLVYFYPEELGYIKQGLERLEQLEKDLGFPLEVLLSKSAMLEKDGVIYEVNIMAVSFTNGNIYFGSEWSFTTRKIKDYGKTWWLKEDKSE